MAKIVADHCQQPVAGSCLLYGEIPKWIDMIALKTAELPLRKEGWKAFEQVADNITHLEFGQKKRYQSSNCIHMGCHVTHSSHARIARHGRRNRDQRGQLKIKRLS